MISVLVFILLVAAIGCVVSFVLKLDIPVILKNLIYLVIALSVIFLLIDVLQTGHLPLLK